MAVRPKGTYTDGTQITEPCIRHERLWRIVQLRLRPDRPRPDQIQPDGLRQEQIAIKFHGFSTCGPARPRPVPRDRDILRLEKPNKFSVYAVLKSCGQLLGEIWPRNRSGSHSPSVTDHLRRPSTAALWPPSAHVVFC